MVVPRWMRNKRRLPRLRSPGEVFPVFPKFRSPSRRGSPPAGRTRLCTAGSAPDGGTTSRRETITCRVTSHAIGGTSGSGKVRMSFRSLARHNLPERQTVPPETESEHSSANSATSRPLPQRKRARTGGAGLRLSLTLARRWAGCQNFQSCLILAHRPALEPIDVSRHILRRRHHLAPAPRRR